jgi:hypothetical protein
MRWILAAVVALAPAACSEPPQSQRVETPSTNEASRMKPSPAQARPSRALSREDWLKRARDATQPFAARLSAAAMERLTHRVVYDPVYLKIPYPMGDVPSGIGVCTDEVIRAYRTLGIDLQRLVHEDMKAHFSLYPKAWGLTRPDTNIDHRRVLNLRVFFARRGKALPVTGNGEDYRAGELVTWMLPGNLPHIGIATHLRSADGKRPLFVHNIGRGPQLEDILFSYKITGRYIFDPAA